MHALMHAHLFSIYSPNHILTDALMHACNIYCIVIFFTPTSYYFTSRVHARVTTKVFMKLAEVNDEWEQNYNGSSSASLNDHQSDSVTAIWSDSFVTSAAASHLTKLISDKMARRPRKLRTGDMQQLKPAKMFQIGGHNY